MRKILFMLIMLISFPLFAQESYEISDTKLTHFLFPTKIEFYKVSLEPHFVLIENEGENLFVQLMTLDIPEANLIIKTIDGEFYNLIIKPSKAPEKLAYILGNSNKSDGEQRGQNYNVTTKENPEDISKKILSEKPYIRSRNTATKGKMYMYIKGTYVRDSYYFVRVEYQNKSNINYKIDKTNFYISEVVTSKDRSTDILSLSPIYMFNNSNEIVGKSSNEVIYVFDKFTIDENKNLIIETLEKGGDRVLHFAISEEILSNAKLI